MKIKTTRYHLSPIGMASVGKTRKYKVLVRMWRNGTLCTVGGTIKQCSLYGKHCVVPQKIEVELLYDPAILLLSIYPKELKVEESFVHPYS